MFERFSDRARRVVVLAQEEARLLNHNYIGTEHVLLGLIHEGEGVAAQALSSLGISLEAARIDVERIIGRGGELPSGHIPFTPRAKKVLELSLREALQLGHDYIGTEHLLLGLLREGEGVAAQVLVKLGADLPSVRARVVDMLGTGQAATSTAQPPAESSEALIDSLTAENARLRGEVDRLRSALRDTLGTAADDPAGQEEGTKPVARAKAFVRKWRSSTQCSFCGKDRDVVAKLVAGPGVYICDECIALCQEILDEELKPPEEE